MPHTNPVERRPLLETLRPWGAFVFLAIVFVLFSWWHVAGGQLLLLVILVVAWLRFRRGEQD
jgi:hypothetical protein